MTNDFERKLLILCDGTRSRNAVARELDVSFYIIKHYRIRHPELGLKFLNLKTGCRNPAEPMLNKSEGETNLLLMQQW